MPAEDRTKDNGAGQTLSRADHGARFTCTRECRMAGSDALYQSLWACGSGGFHLQTWEDACIPILRFLFVPPLVPPKVIRYMVDDTARRDAIYPNRNLGRRGHWGHLHRALGARLILVRFTNSDSPCIGKHEIQRMRRSLIGSFGRFGIICCQQAPAPSDHLVSATAYE